MTLTGPQRTLMSRLKLEPAGFYVYGPEVRPARKLAALGLAKLTDDGTGPDGRNGDGERWSLELTDAGRALVNT